ncbi:MAG: ethanolamine utilization microcompartment protein EutL [Deltaproteobacteria bacterium]|nr:ethanolamine utilization microcompartment protein EutL [Deltaproteobacteria bacterium]
MNLVPLRPKLLTCRMIPHADRALAASLGCDPERHASLGLVTCDQDDSLYAALDHATKFAPVDVVYARSFYAGAAHASGPLSGEIMGVIAADDPDHVAEGLWALRQALAEEICFYTTPGEGRPAFFPHVIASLGRYLSQESGLEVGAPMAYLVAPPVEAMVALDHALKTAQVRMVKFFGPPTETNFASAYLTGELPEVEAAARAFAEAVIEVSDRPLEAAVRPVRLRR